MTQEELERSNRTTFGKLLPGAKFIAFFDDGMGVIPPTDTLIPKPRGAGVFVKLHRPEDWTIPIEPDPRHDNQPPYRNAVALDVGHGCHFADDQDVVQITF